MIKSKVPKDELVKSLLKAIRVEGAEVRFAFEDLTDRLKLHEDRLNVVVDELTELFEKEVEDETSK